MASNTSGLGGWFSSRPAQIPNQDNDQKDFYNLVDERLDQFRTRLDGTDREIQEIKKRTLDSAPARGDCSKIFRPKSRKVDEFKVEEQDEIHHISGWVTDPTERIHFKSGREMNVRRSRNSSQLRNWQPGDRVDIRRKKTGAADDPYELTNETRDDKPKVDGNPKDWCPIL